jgi:hypothetical protein
MPKKTKETESIERQRSDKGKTKNETAVRYGRERAVGRVDESDPR